jgi:hypothetical protein
MSAPLALRNLQPNDDLLRALLKKSHLGSLPDAFLLRQDERDSGLSVRYDCTIEQVRLSFRRSYGVAQIKVANVTMLQLQVIPDEPTHAIIIGVPHKDDDPVKAEWIASQLAKSATIVDRGKIEN